MSASHRRLLALAAAVAVAAHAADAQTRIHYPPELGLLLDIESVSAQPLHETLSTIELVVSPKLPCAELVIFLQATDANGIRDGSGASAKLRRIEPGQRVRATTRLKVFPNGRIDLHGVHCLGEAGTFAIRNGRLVTDAAAGSRGRFSGQPGPAIVGGQASGTQLRDFSAASPGSAPSSSDNRRPADPVRALSDLLKSLPSLGTGPSAPASEPLPVSPN